MAQTTAKLTRVVVASSVLTRQLTTQGLAYLDSKFHDACSCAIEHLGLVSGKGGGEVDS